MNRNGKPITVVAVDDHDVVRDAIQNRLAEREHIELLALGTVGEDVLPLVAAHQPDILVLDLSMPRFKHSAPGVTDFRSIPTLAKLSADYPDTRVIILTQHFVPFMIQEAMARGVQGYLVKTDSFSTNLIQAIEQVYQGEVYYSETIRKWLFNGVDEPGEANLSDRQLAVLSMINTYPDASNAEIGSMLNISHSTVKYHLNLAFAALGVNGRTAAVLRCGELGLFA